MPRVSLPELHEKRDGETQLYKLVNQTRRRFNTVNQRGTTVASADTLVPLFDGDYVHVTGSVAVDFVDVSGLSDGDPLELYFDDGTTLNNGTASAPVNAYSLKLAGGINAVMAAGSKIKLRRDDDLELMVEMWRGAP